MSGGISKRILAWLFALMVACMVAPGSAFADSLSMGTQADDPVDDVVFTVYAGFQTGSDADGNPIVQYTVLKTFTQSDLEGLKPETSEKLGYAMAAKGDAVVLATENYVLVKDILSAAKVSLTSNDTIGFVDGTKYGEDVKRYSKWSASYDDIYGDLKFFSGYSADNTQNVTDPSDAPAIVALSYGQASIATTAYAAYEGITSYDSTSARFMAGQTEESLKESGLRAGNNFPSGVTGIIVDKSSTCSVYAKSVTSAEDAKLIKELSWADMIAASTTNEKGIAVNWNKNRIAVATQYAPIEDVISAAGLIFSDGDVVRVADPTDFGHNVTYAELHNSENPLNYYPHTTASELNTTGAIEVGAVLGLKFIKSVSIGETDAEDAVADAIANGTFEYGYQWMPGATEADYLAGNNSGKRMVSGANVVTVTMANVADAAISAGNQTYTGKALTPAVSVEMPDGLVLSEGTDYTLSYSNNTNAGKGTVTVTGAGSYTGTATGSFDIAAAKQSITVKTTTKTFKKAKVAKKAQSFTIGAKAQGKLTYKVTKSNKKLTFKNGKVTVKKGTKKGTYSIKVKISAKATANYQAASKTVTLKVKVK